MLVNLYTALTFIAVSNCVKVHVILLVGEEKKAEPGVEGIDGDYEKNPNYVPLFIWRAVVTQVHVDLERRRTEKLWESVTPQKSANIHSTAEFVLLLLSFYDSVTSLGHNCFLPETETNIFFWISTKKQQHIFTCNLSIISASRIAKGVVGTFFPDGVMLKQLDFGLCKRATHARNSE